MVTQHPSVPYSAARWRVVQAMAFLLVVIWGLTTLYIWQDRRETIARAEERAQAFGGLAEVFMLSRLREIDAALRDLLDHSGDAAALRASIRLQRRLLPNVSGLYLLPAARDAGSGGDAGMPESMARWARVTSAPPLTLAVGEPADMPEGVPVLPFLLVGADGTRAVATLPCDFLVTMHRMLRLDDTFLSAVINARGMVLARAPYVRSGVGRNIAATDVFKGVPADQQSAVAEFISPVNRRDYLLAMHRLPVAGLSVRAGQPWDDVLDGWRLRSLRAVGLCFILSALGALLARVFLRRVAIEEAARQSYSRRDAEHRLALSNLSEGVVSQTPDGRVQAFNAAALEILGLSEAELLGRSSLDPEWRARREDGQDVPGEEHPVMEAMRTGQPQRGVIMEFANGKGARRWLEINATPILADGKVTGVVGSFSDVTERRAAQRRIEELNRTLEQRVAERTEQLRRLSADLAAAEDRERRQIARDLHDDIAQTLAAARIRLAPWLAASQSEVRECASSVAALIERADASTRSLAAQLAPPMLETLGLAAAIDWLAEEFGTLYGLAIEVENRFGRDAFDPATRMIVFRAVRELLVNVSKHAGVDRARVELGRKEGNMTICVADAGSGFAPERAARGLGLRGMQEYLARVGGTVRIESTPGGTRATIVVPHAVPEPAGGGVTT